MKTIHKYSISITDSVSVRMPVGAQILSFQKQHGELFLWALVDLNYPEETRQFRIIGTGHTIENAADLTYLSTVQIDSFVWHIFEQTDIPF